MELRPSLFCLFFCLLYFFLPPFEELGCFSGCLMMKLQTLKDSNELEIMKTKVKTQKPNYNGTEVMWCACVCVQSLQSCLNLCNPMDSGPPDSSVHGILQARILEWVAISLSRGSYCAAFSGLQSSFSCFSSQWPHDQPGRQV